MYNGWCITNEVSIEIHWKSGRKGLSVVFELMQALITELEQCIMDDVLLMMFL